MSADPPRFRRVVEPTGRSLAEREQDAAKEKWIAEADVRPGEERPQRPKRVREKLHGYHVRLNSEELGGLQDAANDEDTTIQRLLRGLIRDYLKKRTRKVP